MLGFAVFFLFFLLCKQRNERTYTNEKESLQATEEAIITADKTPSASNDGALVYVVGNLRISEVICVFLISKNKNNIFVCDLEIHFLMCIDYKQQLMDRHFRVIGTGVALNVTTEVYRYMLQESRTGLVKTNLEWGEFPVQGDAIVRQVEPENALPNDLYVMFFAQKNVVLLLSVVYVTWRYSKKNHTMCKYPATNIRTHTQNT